MIKIFYNQFNANNPLQRSVAARHGDSIALDAAIIRDTCRVNLKNYTLSGIYQPASQLGTEDFYTCPVEHIHDQADARVYFTGDQDNGENGYRIWLRCERETENNGLEVSYPAVWDLSLQESPGFTPTEIEPIVKVLDFDKITMVNVPFVYLSALPELLSGKADLSAIPTKTSQLENDSGYITEAEISGLSAKADLSALEAHTGDATIHVTATDKTNWNGKADLSALDNYLRLDDGGRLADGAVIAIGGTTPTFAEMTIDGLEVRAEEGLDVVYANYVANGIYADSNNLISFPAVEKPETFAVESKIPTKTSQLENDSGYITEASISSKADLSAIPTKTSDLSNDSGYITEAEISGLSVLSAKADLSALEAHTGDSTIHVTAADKANWNGKADLSALDSYLPLSGGTMTGTTIAEVPVGPAFVATGRDDDYITIDEASYYQDHITHGANSIWFPDRDGYIALKSDLGIYKASDAPVEDNTILLNRESRLYNHLFSELTDTNVWLEVSELMLDPDEVFEGELWLQVGMNPGKPVFDPEAFEWIGSAPEFETYTKYYIKFRVPYDGKILLKNLASSGGVTEEYVDEKIEEALGPIETLLDEVLGNGLGDELDSINGENI